MSAAAAPLRLRRDEMAFRKRYEDALLARAITTVFRPGNRIYPAWRGYRLGEVVSARVIERPGSDLEGVPPVFNAIRIPIRITAIALRRIAELTAADFEGCAEDVGCAQSLLAHLDGIYGDWPERAAGIVTRIHFRYIRGLGALAAQLPGMRRGA